MRVSMTGPEDTLGVTKPHGPPMAVVCAHTSCGPLGTRGGFKAATRCGCGTALSCNLLRWSAHVRLSFMCRVC
jgi:hypothetical protein